MALSKSHSLEKSLVDAADHPEMFELFHVMPDDKMEVVHQLDMLLSLSQYEMLYMGNNEDDDKHNSTTRNKRKAINPRVYFLWPDRKVFYEIMDSLKDDRSVIMEAIEEWEKYTGLEFIESGTQTGRIQFQNAEGCFSRLGYWGSEQPIGLSRGCRTKGIIVHEIGHAIGWIHEHARPDRDEHLRVNLDNVPLASHYNYEKCRRGDIETFDVPYDYTSIMHYGNSLYPGSLIPEKAEFEHVMGQRVGLSFKDIKLANIMYDCLKDANCTHKDCKEGFQLCKPLKGQEKCQCWCDSENLEDPLKLCPETERKKRSPPSSPRSAQLSSDSPTKCMDHRNDCKKMKENGECMTKMGQMMTFCSKTCGFCGKGSGMCMDYQKGCGVMAGRCEDRGLKSTMSQICMATCKVCEPTSPCDIENEMMGQSKGVSTLLLGGISGVTLNVLLCGSVMLLSRISLIEV